MNQFEQQLVNLGLTLPAPATPVAAYVSYVLAGGLLHISGQLPFTPEGTLITGRLGADVDTAAGTAAAERCGLMLIAQVKAAVGDLGKIDRIVKLGGFVASTSQFIDQPKVINGASELMVNVFGDAGRHARSAVGVPSLPLGACVEVDAIVSLKA